MLTPSALAVFRLTTNSNAVGLLDRQIGGYGPAENFVDVDRSPPPKAAQNETVPCMQCKTLMYRASKLDCDVCPLKPQCCPKDPSRKIPRDIHERPGRCPVRSHRGL
jgi:hypothetical protein